MTQIHLLSVSDIFLFGIIIGNQLYSVSVKVINIADNFFNKMEAIFRLCMHISNQYVDYEKILCWL